MKITVEYLRGDKAERREGMCVSDDENVIVIDTGDGLLNISKRFLISTFQRKEDIPATLKRQAGVRGPKSTERVEGVLGDVSIIRKIAEDVSAVSEGRIAILSDILNRAELRKIDGTRVQSILDDLVRKGELRELKGSRYAGVPQ